MLPENHDQHPKSALGNAGFTLLEIIAVLVIMSILAVVAVPKYFDLQQQAREKAMGTGIAEAVGRVNGYFAEQVLSNVTPSNIQYTTTTLGSDLGDFTLTSVTEVLDGATTMLQLTVDGKAGTPVAGLQTTQLVPRPGL